MIAEADGSKPVQVGGDREYPWASWSPDGKQIACLSQKEGIQIVDLETKKVVRELPRKGIYQQLYWSPDGQWFCGVANARMMWTIVRMDAQTGELNVVHEFQSCTPDWFPDSKHIIYPSRPAGQPGNNGYGFTQLWYSDGEGEDAKMIYGEDGYHIYGGALSPDGKYVLFTRCPQDGGGSEKSGAPICVMRMADAPASPARARTCERSTPRPKRLPCCNWWTVGSHSGPIRRNRTHREAARESGLHRDTSDASRATDRACEAARPRASVPLHPYPHN